MQAAETAYGCRKERANSSCASLLSPVLSLAFIRRAFLCRCLPVVSVGRIGVCWQHKSKPNPHGVCRADWFACPKARILFLGLELPPQAGEAVEGLVQRFVLFGEMQPDEMMDRLAEKARAGHGADADVPRQRLAESEVGVIPEFGDVQQDVVRALRGRVWETQVVEPFRNSARLCV